MPDITTHEIAPADLHRGDTIIHLGTRYAVLLVDRRPGGGRVILFVQRTDGSEQRRSVFYGTGERATRVFVPVLSLLGDAS